MQLIDKIAGELGRAGFRGEVNLFSNNEPLLDTRIPEICKVLKISAPLAKQVIYTNGTLLNADVYMQMFGAGLSCLAIDNYSDDGEIIGPLKRTIAELGKSRDPRVEAYLSRTVVYLRRKNQVLTNRGGTAPNKLPSDYSSYVSYRKSSCVLPFLQMVVRPDGKISKCCQDALGQDTLGDVSKDSIMAVWRGEPFRYLRANLSCVGRASESLCRNCDVSILRPDLVPAAVSQVLRPYASIHNPVH
jgi:radical SAM protein with 4Fe4S-binding SPASM domain